jgi:6-pyruvoyl-tetrahydropterin synthase
MPTLFVDQLTVIDFSYVHAERGILGESWIADITLTGDLDEQGMVFDFGDVKKQIKHAIDENYDHKLWIASGLPALNKKLSGNNTEYRWQDTQQRNYYHRSPNSAVVELNIDEINCQNMAPLIAAELKQLLPDNVQAIELQLRQEVIDGANYQYSHGLQKHLGNCQRIAHGHRSAIEIYQNGKRDKGLEQQWAKQWRDIYIGTRSHIKEQQEDSISFLYQAEQGDFELSLPAQSCYLMDTESTVEQIADHIAAALKQQHPDSAITVKAFEGVGKGAIASY